MPKLTMLIGIDLIILGIVVTILSDSGSFTSMIPAIVGAVLALLGVVAVAKPDLTHHLMHAAMAVALIAALASLGSAIGRGSGGWALFSQIITAILCAVLIFFGIRSFRAARLAREAEGALT